MSGRENAVVPMYPDFETTLRGFHRRQVLDYVETVEERMRILDSERADAVRQADSLRRLLEIARHDLDDARERLSRMEMSPTTVPGMSERMRQMMMLAEDESESLRRKAEHEAALVRGTATTLAERTRSDCERLTAELAERIAEQETSYQALVNRQRDEYEQLCDDLITEHDSLMEQADQQAAELIERRTRLCAEFEARTRQRVEAERERLEVELAAERTRRLGEIAEREAMASRRAEFLVRLAAAEARRRVAEVEARHEQLERARETASARLAAVRAAIVTANEQLGLAVTEVAGSVGTPDHLPEPREPSPEAAVTTKKPVEPPRDGHRADGHTDEPDDMAVSAP